MMKKVENDVVSSAVKKKVFFLIRYDAKVKPGGDVNLLKSFSELLSDVCEVEVGDFRGFQKSNGVDYVVAANIDRPVEAFMALRLCKQKGIKFGLYTLHHPYTGIKHYLNNGVVGYRKYVALIARSSPVIYEQLMWWSRCFLGFFLPLYKQLEFSSVSRAQEYLLNNSDAVIVTSKAELEEIDKDIGNVSSNVYEVAHLIPGVNSVDKLSVSEDLKKYKNFVLCPGRIESRKNQNMILKLAKEFSETNFIFVGDKSDTDKSYVKSFDSLLLDLSNVEYLSHVNIDELIYLINESKAVV